jgi:transposase
MEHIAIDLGSRESQLCIRSAQNEVLLERRVATRSLRPVLKKRPPSRVVLETSAEAFAIADIAMECGHEVRVVPATLVRALGVGARGLKTDVRDSRVLSEASVRMELPSVHVPSHQSRELKALCSARESLVHARTKLINNTRGFLRTQTITFRSGSGESFTRRVRDRLATPTEAAAQEAPRRSAKGKTSRSATPKSETDMTLQLPTFVSKMLDAIDALSEQIAALDEQLTTLAESHEVCRRLMTTPGIGPVCATRFAAAIDSIDRFPDASKVHSYIGLVPGEQQSGMTQRRTRMIKSGQPQLRWALIQAAWCLYRTRKSDPLVQWAIAVEQRRGKRIAIVALARKIASVLFALWRDGTEYTPGGVRASKEHAATT